MSGLRQTADLSGRGRHFAFVPEAEVSCGYGGRRGWRQDLTHLACDVILASDDISACTKWRTNELLLVRHPSVAEFPLSMAKKRKAKKGLKNKRPQSDGRASEHVLDQLYVAIDSCKGSDPDTSYAARLFSRDRQQIAKKLGEEAVEALIEGIRGDRPKLVAESADVLCNLLTLWAATGIKPKVVWAELARREGLSGKAAKAARKQ